MKRIRMSVYVKPETAQKVRELAQKEQLSQAAILNTAIVAGIKSIEISNSVEWQEYFERIIREGKPFQLPGITFTEDELT